VKVSQTHAQAEVDPLAQTTAAARGPYGDAVGWPCAGAPADLDTLQQQVRELYDLVRREVRRYGGTVQSVVGERVLIVFGLPAAQEDHAQRAVLTAMALQQRLQQRLSEGAAAAAAAGDGESAVARFQLRGGADSAGGAAGERTAPAGGELPPGLPPALAGQVLCYPAGLVAADPRRQPAGGAIQAAYGPGRGAPAAGYSGESEGNPFFLEELARAVGEHDAAQWPPPVLPETVQAVLAAGLDRLSPQAERLLQVAAVIGQDALCSRGCVTLAIVTHLRSLIVMCQNGFMIIALLCHPLAAPLA
jgi:hypothetical protein